MKIAIIATFPRISETFILRQITGLIDLGHQVRIFSRGVPVEQKVHPDVEKYKLMDMVCYRPEVPSAKMLCRAKAVLMLCGNFVRNPARTLKAVKLFLSDRRNFSYKIFFFVLQVLRHDFDIIHCHYGPIGNRAVYIKKIIPETMVITTFHGYDINSYPNTAGKDVYNQLFKHGDLFTANSNFTKSQAVELGCDETKIKILPVGLDMSRFTFKARQLKADEPVRILTVGRLVEKKGLEYAIKVIAKLTADFPGIIYSIAGEGPLNENLQSLVSSLNLQKNIEFLGALPQQEILKLYDRTHLFLLPSVTAADGDREGQALVLQEAQACGIPVLSTIHNGIPDGVLDGKSGFLVPEKDVDSLAEKLQYLIQNPQLWPQMGKAGREFVENKYDIKILNEKLVQIYQELLQQ